MPGHTFTAEQLRQWPTEKLRTLRDNASRKGVGEIVELCESELASRAPKKPLRQQSEHDGGDVVVGYHFVCSRDRGVLGAGPGRFWSGAWVVAEANVQLSLKHGAYLALHESKAEPSYRQGQIIEYRIGDRDMVDKSNKGIEFLVEETSVPLPWVGGGSGEKGYNWARLHGRRSEDKG